MALPQGDLGLLDEDLARELLGSPTLARLAYVWSDGTPRVVPTWFHWTGSEVVFGARVNSHKTIALEKNPAVAITIDRPDPPSVLLIRGKAVISVEEGVLSEMEEAAGRYLGPESGAGWVSGMKAQVEQMARISVRPTWVGLLDFVTRMPAAMGGIL